MKADGNSRWETSKPMSIKRHSSRSAAAEVFAALGDETRLLLLAKLCEGRRPSIAELTEGTKLTRQAVTKHLRVLEKAQIVHARRAGRERLFDLDPVPIWEMKEYLESVGNAWEGALGRLKMFVESEKS
jgi:DNA-binding transcriptional ArsR family regulator